MGTSAPSKEQVQADRAAKAKRLADAAQRKATKVAESTETNRSTRTRHALKVKADALDKITEVLAGRA